MKKILALGLVSLVMLGAGCSLPSREERVLDTAIEKTTKSYDDWVRQHAGGAPSDIIDTRYTDAVAASGEGPSATFTYWYNDLPQWPHGYYVAEQLSLDYEKLAFIQYYYGTYGIESTVAAMDQSMTGVATTLETLQVYHGVIDGEAAYFTDITSADTSDQEKANAIVARFADNYRVFYPQQPEPWGENILLLNKLVTLTGIEEADLAYVVDKYTAKKAFTLMPDSLAYKTEALTLIGD